MALMFQQLAHNFIKNGYYPTDPATIESVLNKLVPSQSGTMRIIDPCAGEGSALAECQHALQQPVTVKNMPVETFGVEYDKERSIQAKGLLNRCIYGDFQDTVITPKSFGLLWLNPPYGDLVSDKGQTGSLVSGKGKKRLEKVFYQRSARLLQYGGVMVLIIPHYTLDSEFRRWIAAGFKNVTVYLAPEQRFKQAVVIGTRRRTSTCDVTYRETLDILEQFSEADNKSAVPGHKVESYMIPPATSGEIRFNALRIDEQQLQEEIDKYPCLWPQFTMHMNSISQGHRRPLMELSDWHLALALATGQVSGVVHSNDGQKTYVIKGDTFKDKKQSSQLVPQGDGEFQEIRTSIDVFVPQIKAIDFTPQSEMFGEILTIK